MADGFSLLLCPYIPVFFLLCEMFLTNLIGIFFIKFMLLSLLDTQFDKSYTKSIENAQ